MKLGNPNLTLARQQSIGYRLSIYNMLSILPYNRANLGEFVLRQHYIVACLRADRASDFMSSYSPAPAPATTSRHPADCRRHRVALN